MALSRPKQVVFSGCSGVSSLLTLKVRCGPMIIKLGEYQGKSDVSLRQSNYGSTATMELELDPGELERLYATIKKQCN